jgi:hypothetical protein
VKEVVFNKHGKYIVKLTDRKNQNHKKTVNKCVHNKNAPRNSITTPPKNAPQAIRKTIEIVKKFAATPSVLIALQRSGTSNRTRRSESRESITLTLQALLKYVDLETLKVGFKLKNNPNKLHSISIQKIAEQADLSLSRTERAIRALREIGLLKTFRVCETYKDDQGKTKFRALNCVKTISPALFVMTGNLSQLKKDRKYAYKTNTAKRDRFAASTNQFYKEQSPRAMVAQAERVYSKNADPLPH